jgi:hypothetical protein
MEGTDMSATEVDFKLLDFVQTANGKCFSISFMDNENKRTLSKKTAHALYQKGLLVNKSEEVNGKITFEKLIPYRISRTGKPTALAVG